MLFNVPHFSANLNFAMFYTPLHSPPANKLLLLFPYTFGPAAGSNQFGSNLYIDAFDQARHWTFLTKALNAALEQKSVLAVTAAWTLWKYLYDFF